MTIIAPSLSCIIDLHVGITKVSTKGGTTEMRMRGKIHVTGKIGRTQTSDTNNVLCTLHGSHTAIDNLLSNERQRGTH